MRYRLPGRSLKCPPWSGASRLQSDEFYWSRMRWWDQQFKDPTYLATLTLGELGALLECTVHNDMHMRWAALRKRRGAVQWFEPGRWVQVAKPWVWPAQFPGGGHSAHSDHEDGHGSNGHDIDPDERLRRIASMEQMLAILYEPAARADAEFAEPFDLALKLPI